MAVNDPKWANGSIVLMQSTDVAWLDGSVLFDFEYAAVGEDGNAPTGIFYGPLAGPLAGPI